MPWAASARAILMQFMPGQASGTAIAQTIFGINNPSGKLAVSFPAKMNDTWLSTPPGGPIDPNLYPGSDRGGYNPVVDYSEGLGFGYRFYDVHPELPPLWAFGRGLSYSTFVYNSLVVEGNVSLTTNATVSLTVTNVAGPAGAEIVQLYISPPSTIADGPVKMLKGFEKVLLLPGQTQSLTFSLSAIELATFDVFVDDFVLVPGTYGVLIAAASDDIRLHGVIECS